jgi:mycofactocin precursor
VVRGVRLTLESREVVVLADDTEVQDTEAQSDDEIDELLVEEVSIDGMCGVY